MTNQIDVTLDSRLTLRATGNGITDDTGAIRAAIQLAVSTGGGVVYFPPGDYKIVTPSNATQGSPLGVPSRVILRGSSSTASRIFVNDPSAASETDGEWTWGGIKFQGSSLSGMTDLGVFAVNPSASPCAVLWNRGSSGVDEIFFHNLDVHLENCRSVWFEGANRLLVEGSNIDSNSSQGGLAAQAGPLFVVNTTGASFLNNKITYCFGRVHVRSNLNLIFQGNTLIRNALGRDKDNGTAIESGGVEISFGQNIQVLKNTIQTLNAPADERGDGEAIMAQNSNVPDVLDAGSATGVSATTLTDTSALWGTVTASRLPQYQEVVAILSGSATGEWRAIQGVDTTTKTLTLTQPWNPLPQVGSLYSIFVWTLTNSTIQGNTLIDNPNGIVLWDGAYNCLIQNNTLTNSRAILLRAADFSPLSPYLSPNPESRRAHFMALSDKIQNNAVSNTSGVRPAYVALDVEAFSTDYYHGLGMMDVQVGINTVNPYPSNPSQSYSPSLNEIPQDGYFPCFLYGPAPVQDPVTTVFQKVNFWSDSQSMTVSYIPGFLPYTTQACVTTSAP